MLDRGKERGKRGDMPRQARLDAPGALHHVVGRRIEGIRRKKEGISESMQKLMTGYVVRGVMSCGVVCFSMNVKMESQYFTYCVTASLTDL